LKGRGNGNLSRREKRKLLKLKNSDLRESESKSNKTS